MFRTGKPLGPPLRSNTSLEHALTADCVRPVIVLLVVMVMLLVMVVMVVGGSCW